MPGNDNMIPIPNNTDVVCYYVTKHSWRGKYKRIFGIGTQGITTYNPNSLEVTNRYTYNQIVSIQVDQQNAGGFILSVKDKNKVDRYKFSTDIRSNLLTDALKNRYQFAERGQDDTFRYEAFKYHWSDTRLPVTINVTPISVDQLDTATAQILASYRYKDIEAIQNVEDIPGGFVIISRPYGRMHLFISLSREDILQKVKEKAMIYLQIPVEFFGHSLNHGEFLAKRLGRYSSDEHVTSVCEFQVKKIGVPRHQECPQRRLLCLSEVCLLERDPQTYTVVTLRPLSSVFALIRDPIDAQQFCIEYTDSSCRSYTATNRDSLLATLLDSVRSSGNHHVHVKISPTSRDKRLIPFNLPPDQEIESNHLKCIKEPPPKKSFADVLDRFNANIEYSGLIHSVSEDKLFTENKEKLIVMALTSIIAHQGDQNEIPVHELEAQFHALRRLFATKAGFSTFIMLPELKDKLGRKVTRALKRDNEAITHAALDMICTLMQPMHRDSDIRQEQLNKASLLATPSFLESLLDMWVEHIKRGTGALVVSAMLDILTFALCVPYSETTDGTHFDTLLTLVAKRGRFLFQLFQHPSLTVVKGAGLVMRAIIEEGDAEISGRMQELALAEAALPSHLLTALFTRDDNRRMLVHRQLSRHLVGLWVTNNSIAMDLLSRVMPTGLIGFLESNETVEYTENDDPLITRDNLKLAQDHAAKNQRNPHLVALERKFRTFEKEVEVALGHWGTSLGLERKDDKLQARPIVLRRRRERVKSAANWKLFYYKFNQNHTSPSLLWNHQTREELHDALKKEIQTFNSDRQLTTNNLIAWNHDEFEVIYPSLQDEVCIDGYYLRLLLDGSINFAIKNPFRFFYDLYHRFLLALKIEMKCLCLQAMTVIYGQYYEDIGPFTDTKYIIIKLEKAIEKSERDRLIIFLSKLILNKQNVKDIIECKGILVLVDLLTLAHLHTTRAVVPTQTNVIEAGQNMLYDNEKQWYYGVGGNSDKSNGPLTFKEMRDLYKEGVIKPITKCWTQGLEGWKPLHKLNQFKWTLMAKDQGYMNESDLASLILSMLIKMCQYYPSRDNDGAIIWPIARIRRILTDQLNLPHIVQLLLTFDPILVEKVAALLCEVASDNPNAAKLYMTGVFFFLLMYTGSNILPIARFLRLTHTCQAFRSEEVQSGELMQRSVLGPLLPEAMVYYLENHGPEKFAQIFLGEFDTPEAIWNAEMRRMLIEKIACHIADFTPKLRGNNRAKYQYCAIPVVRYPQLQAELFCNIFYLRHLCDVQRFSDWPINDPITLLKDVLEAWKNEVEKKPPTMSVDDAYESLGLERGCNHDEATTRKAYYKIAQVNHPDKNPKGREKFVAANKAYDFLCSRSLWGHDGPNPNNILLILQTQSILFDRYSADLEPYKYAGYKQLVKTIRLEASDEQLFSKSNMLLSAASELAYHTVKCSALNAEELNREQGFVDLLNAYSRCVSVLNKSSVHTEMSVSVCVNCTRCFKVASQFAMCRDTFSQMTQLVNDVTRILYFKNLPKLCCDAVECIYAMASDSILQNNFLQKGAVWHLLTYMFSYDYTLEECGVERTEEANNQEVLNRLAKLSVQACARLAGYYKSDLATPENYIAKSLFDKLLTPYIAEQLSEENPHELLKILASNCETPYLVWDNSTRAELGDFLDTMCNRKEMVNLEKVGLTFSSHRNELIVGNVFIRVFNEQPHYTIKNPTAFLSDLIEYIEVNNPTNNILEEKRMVHFVMVLNALNNLILNNPNLEVNCIGNFDLLFSLLRVDNTSVQNCALNIILTVTKNNECVTDIANSGVVVYILLCLYSAPSDRIIILDILITLATSSTIVKDILNKGGHLFAVDLLCNGSNDSGLRDKSAVLLSRLMADKLSGPRLRLALAQILPLAIVDTMRDLPLSTVQLLDNDQENPELVWNEKTRKYIYGSINKISKEHYSVIRQNPKGSVKLPDTSLLLSTPSNETIVAGVYLRLFNNNPGWNVRRPKEFLSELLDTCISSMTKEKNNQLEIITTSIVKLLEAQPHLSDQVPSLGHIPRLCFQLSLLSNPDVPKSVLMILHQLSLNEVCVGSISQIECIGPIKKAMQTHSNLVCVSSETLSRMFAARKDYLVKQALDADLISYLVGLLDGKLDGVDGSARAKAQIVKALKTMSMNISYGSLVQAKLDKLPAWSAYKDQNHDLFISSAPSMPYLMGVQSTGGYLTEGRSSTTTSNVPPPLFKKNFPPY